MKKFVKSKRFIIALAVLSVAFITGIAFAFSRINNQESPAQVIFPKEARFVQNQIIVRYHEGRSPEELLTQGKDQELESLQRNLQSIGVSTQNKLFTTSDTILENYYVLQLSQTTNAKAVYPKLKSIRQIDTAAPNYILKIQDIPDDPYFPGMWNLKQIKMEEAWQTVHGNENSIVGVIDTGADFSHEDLFGAIIPGWNFIGNNDNPVDDNGHGTHVAGTIGAITDNAIGISGVTWGARVMAVKACDSKGDCDTAQVAQGVKYAIDHGAKIINISISGDGSCQGTYNDIASYAKSKGALIVAAAGNHNKNASLEIPGACQDILAVGALNSQGERAEYSNYGEKVEISAPGGEKSNGACTQEGCIMSTALGNAYELRSGTSMASPHIAGVAGLILSRNPNLNGEQVKKILIDTGDSLSTDQPIGKLVNAAKALLESSKYEGAEGGKSNQGGSLDLTSGIGGIAFVNTDVSGAIRFSINTLIALGITLSLIVVLYGGIMWILSRGDPEKVAHARRVITGAIIGLIIVILSWVLVGTVVFLLTGKRLSEIELGGIGGRKDASTVTPQKNKKVTPKVSPVVTSPEELSGSLTGTVFIDSNGNKRQDGQEKVVPRIILNLSGPENRTVETNENGRYAFQDLTSGSYSLVMLDAQNRVISEPVTVTIGDTPISVDFPIAASIESTLPPENTPVSPSQTNSVTSQRDSQNLSGCHPDPNCNSSKTIQICKLICN